MPRNFQEITDAARILIRNGQLELGEEIGSVPLQEYLSPEVFAHEQTKIFEARPLPFIPAGKIPKPGDYSAGELLGRRLLAVRGEDSKARVYFDACRHRGAKLSRADSGCARGGFTCPFHGWKYSPSGQLLDPAAGGQEILPRSRSAFALRELPAFEFGGILWVGFSEAARNPDRSVLETISAEMRELGVEPRHAVKVHSFTAGFNWKLGIEAFLEVYHFGHAHAPYLSDLKFPLLSLHDPLGEGCRIVVPLDEPTEGRNPLAWAQVMYFVFPSAFFLVYDDHCAFLSLLPEGPDRTRFTYIPIVPEGGNLRGEVILQKVAFLEKIIAQDIAILEEVQINLGGGGNSRFTFTKLEHPLLRFHEVLRKLQNEGDY
jgi:phenylpropionate dioxygenase-like ring-hydroxylating dioxygenase large terminal subunit